MRFPFMHKKTSLSGGKVKFAGWVFAIGAGVAFAASWAAGQLGSWKWFGGAC